MKITLVAQLFAKGLGNSLFSSYSKSLNDQYIDAGAEGPLRGPGAHQI